MQGIQRRRCDGRTPRGIYDHLSRYVVGQERAKRALAIAAYDHMRRLSAPRDDEDKSSLKKANILMIGPTGSGKTHLARHLAAVLEVPFCVVDATEFTEAGYYGRDVEQMITELLIAAEHDVQACSQGIIFIDEVDKVARRSQIAQTGAGTRDIGGEGVQQTLLKLLEGREVFVPLCQSPGMGRHEYATIDTSDILFICAGTFSDVLDQRSQTNVGFRRHADRNASKAQASGASLTKTLRSFGMLEEFMGRLPVRVELERLSEAHMLEILTNTQDNVLAEYSRRLAMDGVEVSFEPDGLKAIVAGAHRRGLGARGLRGVMAEIMAETLFEAPDQSFTQLKVDRDFVLANLNDNGMS